MKKTVAFLLLSILAACGDEIGPKTVFWTIGPMVHINFGKGSIKPSLALEGAAWIDFFFGMDAGVEIEKGKARIYYEFQTGLVFFGLSMGSVCEFASERDAAAVGFQTSLWGACFGGGDLRYRRIDGRNYFCPGAFVKYVTPIPHGM